MNKNEISLRYTKSLVININEDVLTDPQLAASFAAATAQLGFIPSQDLMNALSALDRCELRVLYTDVIDTLKKMVGANVKHSPMYKNFPDEVMDMDETQLYFNAIIHYITMGEWLPESVAEPRSPFSEDVSYREIGLATEEDFAQIFDRLLKSNDSLSTVDKQTIEWFVDNYDTKITYEIPFKETMCYLAGLFFERGESIVDIPKTATDVLRIATHLSGGDISLGQKTKFKNLPRFQRKELVQALDRVIREEDIARHASKWVRLAHNLHVGDYSDKVYNIIKKVRENEKIKTFNSKVEVAIFNEDVSAAVKLLKTRPSEFARRVDHLIRLSSAPTTEVVNHFLQVVNDVPTRVLMQLLGSLKARGVDRPERVVFPKGSISKAYVVDVALPKMKVVTRNKLMTGIEDILIRRFSTLDSLGKVYVDPALQDAPLPSGMRSASKSISQVARGTHLPFGDDKDTLRFFLYWKGRDIDLSATFHDEDFKFMRDVAYYNLKAGQCAHSGDITSAPRGASEFIDINIPYALSQGWRYVLMDVRVFSGGNFSDHDECFAGWMLRDKVKSGEIYEPKSVQNKIDLTSETRHSVPVAFDLQERVAIWTDLSNANVRQCSNARGGKASLEKTLQAITSCDNKSTISDLLTLHALARGELVDTPEEADVVFDTSTAFKTDVINSEYLL